MSNRPDEPLSALDENLREEMRREIDNLQQMLGVTTIFVTHDQREALSMSDKIVVMKDGSKLQEGPPEEVYDAPVNHFVADFLGHSNFISGTVAEPKGDWLAVHLKTGTRILADAFGEWRSGDPVEIVIRAQKFSINARENHHAQPDTNCFYGKIKDRSYMGGEVRYFVELEGGADFHVISMAKSRTFRKGQEVVLQVSPEHCRLLKREGVNQSDD